MTGLINSMMTGYNKQQRTGKSYIHAVLRDAGRPYAYRNTARRLLQASGTFRMRAIYGNGFMPVNFRYMHAPYFGHDSGVNGDSFLPEAVPASMQEHGRANETWRDLPVKDGMNAGLPQQLTAGHGDGSIATPLRRLGGETRTTVHAQPDVKPLAMTATPKSSANTIDIRIPDSGGQTRNGDKTSDSKNTKVQHSTAAATPPSNKQAVSGAARPHIAATMLQRLPPGLSPAYLAKALEQHNFRKQDRATNAGETAIGPQAESAVPRENSGLLKVSNARQAVVGVQHVESAPKLIDKTYPAPVIVGPMVAAQQPPLEMTTIRKRLAASSTRAQGQRGSSRRFEETFADSTNKRMHKVRRTPVRYRQLTVIRKAAPDAFWERSYLPRLELRMYR